MTMLLRKPTATLWAVAWSLLFLNSPPLSAADYTAFNDHIAGPATHANATSYDASGAASGPLQEITTGQSLPITLTTSGSGYRLEGTTGVPPAGSDAAAVFDGYVDFSSASGASIALTGTGAYTHAFTGLDPEHSFEFVGTAIRGNSSYADRWTLVTITGADSFRAEHSAQIGVVTEGLPAHQVAFWAGANHEAGQGWVVRWADIDPGPDGAFSIVSQRYQGPTPGVGSGMATADKSYALHGIRLTGAVLAGLPTVHNQPATQITESSATVGGTIVGVGDSTPSVTLFHGTTDGGIVAADWQFRIELGEQSGNFTYDLAHLQPRQAYYFTARAVNTAGTRWAQPTEMFQTDALPPMIRSDAAQNVAYVSAELAGTVEQTGGDPPQVTVFYGRQDGGTNPSAWEFEEPIGPKSGSFLLTVENLLPNSRYFHRVRGVNSAGTAWAPQSLSFDTLSLSLPSVALFEAANISAVSARLAGEILSTGGESPAVSLFYGPTDGQRDAASWANQILLGDQAAGFASVLSGLEPDRTYFFTARATNFVGAAWAPATLSFHTPTLSDVLITEFMAVNETTVVPGSRPGEFEDWIELHNRGASPVDLTGWHLTDNPSNPDAWPIPPGTTIAPEGFLVFIASGKDLRDSWGKIHTDFSLNRDGDYLALVRPDLTVANAFAADGVDYPPQSPDISYGLDPADLTSVFLEVVTPGAPNNPNGYAVVRDTQFSHRRGFYTTPFALTITTRTEDAIIRYTLDGTVPTETGAGGSTYTSPIPINTTTTLRARAFRTGYRPTNTDTQTYLFPEAIARQTRPSGYPTAWGAEPAADYDMDTSITLDDTYADRFRAGLQSIPTLSIVAHPDDLFGPGGIYSNTGDRTLIKSASAEYFLPDATQEGLNSEDGFQIDAGVKIQGGASRTPSKAIKHSLSLRFRTEFGPGKLDYRLFPDSRVTTFNSLQLRALYNNSWIHSDPSQRNRATLLRDQWMRDALIAMGNADGGHGRFVHLFLNGLYWGVYNLHERPENSHYAEYNGGISDEILGYNPADPRPATFTAMLNTAASGDWSAIQHVLDVNNYIDWYLMQHFAHNDDLKNNGNWRAAGGGIANAPWRFYSWDSERILENVSNTSSLAVAQDPSGLIDSLGSLPEFRIRFADRLQKHLFHDGALSTAKNREHWLARAMEIDTAIIAESARWGDDRSGGSVNGNYTRDAEWITEVEQVRDQFFPLTTPNRSSYMIAKYRSETWPSSGEPKLLSLHAPLFLVNGVEQHGGQITPTDSLTAAASVGMVYYTTDGSDPRLENGALNPNALRWQNAILLPASSLLRMRTLNNGSWSALTEAAFQIYPTPQPGELVLTEIHYHPYAPFPAEQAAARQFTPPLALTDGDFEFVELRNVSNHPLNLTGVTLSGGIAFTFGNWDLAPDGYVLVVEDPERFALRYGEFLPVAGTWIGALNNAGETMTLHNRNHTELQHVAFESTDLWPNRPNGLGSSLELLRADPIVDAPASYQASSEFGGSPGRLGLDPNHQIVINEVLTHTDLPQVDTIELLNITNQPVDISGWFLSDSSDNYRKFELPTPTVLQPGEFLLIEETEFNPLTPEPIENYAGPGDVVISSPAHGLQTGDLITITGYAGYPGYNGSHRVVVLTADHFTLPLAFADNHPTKGGWFRGAPFALSSVGDDVWLMEANAGGELLRFADHREFGAAQNGVSFGIHRIGPGEERFTTQESLTLGAANGPPLLGPVVITEIGYAPLTAEFEFVEVYNRTPANVPLFDPSQAENRWRLDGTGFVFPKDVTLSPDEIALVVKGDPELFRNSHTVPSSVRIFGPFPGYLDNAGESLRLQRPDSPNLLFVPLIDVDAVDYEPVAPWPVLSIGAGHSLERINPNAFGDDPQNWKASATPGGTPGRLDIVPPSVIPSAWLKLYYSATEIADPETTGSWADSDQDGRPTFVEYALRSNPTVPETDPGFRVRIVDLTVATETQTFLTVEFNRRTDNPSLHYALLVSEDLADWHPLINGLPPFVEHDRTPHGDGSETVRLREPAPFDAGSPSRYVQLQIGFE